MKLDRTRNRHTRCVLALWGLSLFAALAHASFQRPLRAGEYSKPQGWDHVVEDARKEGVVNVYGGNAPYLIQPFQKAFPGIKINAALGQGYQLVTRIAAERRAGKNIADVLLGPGATAIPPFKAKGILAPLKPALALPEVLDPSAWLDNRPWWLDASEPHTVLMFVGSLSTPVTYNTQLVNPAEFKSYWDLLRPKWKGRIVANDARQPGGSQSVMRFWYLHPALGPKFIERLFGETDATLSRDRRQMVDWIARGRFPLGVLVSDTAEAIRQGLPIADLPSDQFKEGGPIAASGGTVSLISQGPNPNAAKVFVNWLLSREGQTVWQKFTRNSSLRVDIPKSDLPPSEVPKPGRNYTNGSHEEVVALSPSLIRDVIVKALEKKNQLP